MRHLAIVAAAGMSIASGIGLIVGNTVGEDPKAWDEQPGQYLLEFADCNAAAELQAALGEVADVIELGLTQHLAKFTLTTTSQRVDDVTIEELRGEDDEPRLTAEALAERLGESRRPDDDNETY